MSSACWKLLLLCRHDYSTSCSKTPNHRIKSFLDCENFSPYVNDSKTILADFLCYLYVKNCAYFSSTSTLLIDLKRLNGASNIFMIVKHCFRMLMTQKLFLYIVHGNLLFQKLTSGRMLPAIFQILQYFEQCPVDLAHIMQNGFGPKTPQFLYSEEKCMKR